MFTRKPKTRQKGPTGFLDPIFSQFREIRENLELNGFVGQNTFKKTVWCFFLVFIYIFFQHNIETLVKRKEKAEVQMKESQASYIGQKARYMYESKHSEVSKKMDELGMIQNMEPPIKIVVED